MGKLDKLSFKWLQVNHALSNSHQGDQDSFEMHFPPPFSKYTVVGPGVWLENSGS